MIKSLALIKNVHFQPEKMWGLSTFICPKLEQKIRKNFVHKNEKNQKFQDDESRWGMREHGDNEVPVVCTTS